MNSINATDCPGCDGTGLIDVLDPSTDAIIGWERCHGMHGFYWYQKDLINKLPFVGAPF